MKLILIIFSAIVLSGCIRTVSYTCDDDSSEIRATFYLACIKSSGIIEKNQDSILFSSDECLDASDRLYCKEIITFK
jgi:hypothetical protein